MSAGKVLTRKKVSDIQKLHPDEVYEIAGTLPIFGIASLSDHELLNRVVEELLILRQIANDVGWSKTNWVKSTYQLPAPAPAPAPSATKTLPAPPPTPPKVITPNRAIILVNPVPSGAVRVIHGQRVLDLPVLVGKTVGHARKILTSQYGISAKANVMLNGMPVFNHTILKNGDILLIK